MDRDESRYTLTFALALGITLVLMLIGLSLLRDQDEADAADQADERALPAAPVTFATTYSTAWSTPADARLALEAQTALVERIAHAHGGAVRVLATNAYVRTRDEQGARLASPVARFERIFELQAPHERHDASLRRALEGVHVVARASVGTTHLPRMSVAADFQERGR